MSWQKSFKFFFFCVFRRGMFFEQFGKEPCGATLCHMQNVANFIGIGSGIEWVLRACQPPVCPTPLRSLNTTSSFYYLRLRAILLSIFSRLRVFRVSVFSWRSQRVLMLVNIFIEFTLPTAATLFANMPKSTSPRQTQNQITRLGTPENSFAGSLVGKCNSKPIGDRSRFVVETALAGNPSSSH